MGFVADHPNFSSDEDADSLDTRPVCVQEGRLGYFYLSYDDASPNVIGALADEFVVRDRIRQKDQPYILYEAYHPSFAPNADVGHPPTYRLFVTYDEAGTPSFKTELQWYSADVG